MKHPNASCALRLSGVLGLLPKPLLIVIVELSTKKLRTQILCNILPYYTILYFFYLNLIKHLINSLVLLCNTLFKYFWYNGHFMYGMLLEPNDARVNRLICFQSELATTGFIIVTSWKVCYDFSSAESTIYHREYNDGQKEWILRTAVAVNTTVEKMPSTNTGQNKTK